MTSWVLNGAESLTAEQRRVAEGVAEMLERLDLTQLDVPRSSAVADTNGFHVALRHRLHPGLRIDVDAANSEEVVVSYGLEHEHFRREDAEVGRVWPFPSDDHVRATLTLVECLLTGRIELHVQRGLLWVRTTSYWVNDAGERELFLRGSTLLPTLRRAAPVIRTFGYHR